MRFLSVADRELRCAARHQSTYRTRWVTAALFLGLLLWLMWAFHGLGSRQAGPSIFKAFSVLAFLYCLFLSAARTADCISAERREGTLGLLFLTNLNSSEIVAGKLCSHVLGSVYGLMALFPMLALPLLLGGVTFGCFWRTVLAVLNGMLFGLAAGFLVSVLCKRQFTALALTLGLTLGLCGGLLLGAAAAASYGPTHALAGVAAFSPFYTLFAAQSTPGLGTIHFWRSIAAVAGLSIAGLSLTTLLLARTWRDRPKCPRTWLAFRPRRSARPTPSAGRVALRRRLLAINPAFWLAARQRVSAPGFMIVAVVLVGLTVYLAAPYFGRVMSGPLWAKPVLGQLFAWFWVGLVIHGLVLYYAAMCAAQPLAEAKASGALELLLSTPIGERTLSRGLWLAYWRRMAFPVLLAVLVHVFFIWMGLVMATLDPPGHLPLGTTPGEIFWSALLERPLRGRVLYWEFGFLLRCVLFFLLLVALSWPTLGWVGRWLGLRMKHSGLALMMALALVVIPPILLFSLACYLADKWQLTRLPDRQLLPAMAWLAVAIGICHCLLLSAWAATRLRWELRAVALSRYQPLPGWRWGLRLAPPRQPGLR